MGQAQTVAMNRPIPSWQTASSCVSQETIFQCFGFCDSPIKIFVDDLYIGIECTLTKFADNTKLGESVDVLQDREAVPRDLDRFNHWAGDSSTRFNKAKSWVLHLHYNKPMQCCRLGEDWHKNCSAERDLGVLVNSHLNMSQCVIR